MFFVQFEQLSNAAFILQNVCVLIPSCEDYQNGAFIQLLIGIKEVNFRFLITLNLLKAHCAYLHVQRELFQLAQRNSLRRWAEIFWMLSVVLKKVLLEIKKFLPLPLLQCSDVWNMSCYCVEIKITWNIILIDFLLI